MTTFSDLNLSLALTKNLEARGLITPTPIQEQAIPVALQGKDILGLSQTGSGKTLAFALPIVEQVLNNSSSGALILLPTRELAQQVLATVKTLVASTNIKTAFLIGGDGWRAQALQLKAQPRIIVGTPGRVIDHLERGNLKTQFINILVLDEMDRMLDMGFGIQLEQIISTLPQKRQNLMFSATLPTNIARLAQKYLQDPVQINIVTTNEDRSHIKQECITVKEKEKFSKLVDQLNARDGSIIIFVKRKATADELAYKLCQSNQEALAIHGDLKQNKRDRVMNAFRKGRSRIMVATDLAARGLDIPHIKHVINYDLPQTAKDYIHRIGRTGRAGAHGNALCIITAQESRKWAFLTKNKSENETAENRDFPRKPRGKSFGGGFKGGSSRNPAAKKPFKFGSKKPRRQAS